MINLSKINSENCIRINMAQKYKSPRIDERVLINNPFIGTLSIGVVKYLDKDRLVKDDDGHYLPETFDLEMDKPVRVYVSSDRRKVLNGLSPNSSKLLAWCQQELVINNDWFWLNKQRYMDETGVAYNTYKKSVNELQVSGLISPTIYADVFWINPHFFFRGNRVKKYSVHKGVVEMKQDRSDGVFQGGGKTKK